MAGCIVTFCKVYVVIVNIVNILNGLLLTVIGGILLAGVNVIVNSLKQTLNMDVVEKLQEIIKDLLDVDIDIDGLLQSLSEITGTVAIVILVVGIIMVIVSVLGCCGVLASNKICLIIFLVFISAFIIGQITVVGMMLANKQLATSIYRSQLEGLVKEFTGLRSNNIQSLLLNGLQIFVGCCGITNGKDFHSLSPKWQPNRNITAEIEGKNISVYLEYPISCCQFDLAKLQPQSEYCVQNNTMSNSERGCFEPVAEQIRQFQVFDIVSYVVLGACVAQILFVIGVVMIIMSIRSSEYDDKLHPI